MLQLGATAATHGGGVVGGREGVRMRVVLLVRVVVRGGQIDEKVTSAAGLQLVWRLAQQPPCVTATATTIAMLVE